MPRISDSLRWPLRTRLRRLRRTTASPPAAWNSVLYLFAGTYGDFVQILRPLEALAHAAPQARIHLLAPETLAHDFRSFLPLTVRPVGFRQTLWRCLRGTDVLLTNAVGAYRVRFEMLACVGGRMALGFRYAEQRTRRSYSATLPLTPALRNFETANLGLLRLAGVDRPASRPEPGARDPVSTGILFHVGSAGFRRSLGPEKYFDLVRRVLDLVADRVEEIVSGPGDEDLIGKLKVVFPGLRFARYDLAALAGRVKNFEGSLLCFNSFFAHLCRYLGRSATVIHQERIPFGYDCAPLHRQVLMQDVGQAFPMVSG